MPGSGNHPWVGGGLVKGTLRVGFRGRVYVLAKGKGTTAWRARVFVRTSVEGSLSEGVGVPFALAVYYVKGLKNVKGQLHEGRGICQKRNECGGNYCVKGRGGGSLALAVYYVKGLKNVKGHMHEGTAA